MDLYQDLGGAKGRGLKKKQFEELALAMGVKVTAFKRFVSTRFRTLKDLHQASFGNVPCDSCLLQGCEETLEQRKQEKLYQMPAG